MPLLSTALAQELAAASAPTPSASTSSPQIARPRQRRETPCNACRARRAKCDSHVRAPERCSRCVQLNVPCLVGNATLDDAREANANSEVRAQLHRLTDILDSLAGSHAHTASVDEDLAEDGEEKDLTHIPRDTDLVGQFARLCFSEADGPMREESGEFGEVLARAKQALREDDEMRARLTGETEEDRRYNGSTATLSDLLEMLPTPAEVIDVLDYAQSPLAFCVAMDHLFAPDYYYDLREWANSKRPWPFSTSRLAEFYAWYAIMSEDADVSSAKSKWEGAVPAPLKHRKIETCMRSAQRALELANYLEEPDLPCIRALSLIAFRFSCSAPTTDHVPRGLATATTAIALAQQLDLHREDLESRKSESAMDRYGRRSILCALLRVVWSMSPCAFGRAAILPDALRDVALPEYLDANFLPTRLLNLPRASREDMEMIHLRHHFTILVHDIAQVLARGNVVKMSLFRSLHERLLALTAKIPKKYGYHITADDRIEPNAPLHDAKSLMQSKMVSDYSEITHVTMHRLSLGLHRDVRCDQRIVRYHSGELIKHARIVLFSFARMARNQLGHMAAFAYSFTSHIALAVSAILDLVDEAQRTTYRDEARQTIALFDRPDMRFCLPPAVRKLTVICRLLHDQPRLRSAHAGEAPTAKRSRPSDPFMAQGRPSAKSPMPDSDSDRSRKTAFVSPSATTDLTSPPLASLTKSSSRQSSDDVLATPLDPSPSDELFKGTFDFVVPPMSDGEFSAMLEGLVGDDAPGLFSMPA